MALKNQTRIVQQRGTKAEVEAFTASLEEGALAYATDTGEIGIYTNGSWVWSGAGDAGDITYTPTVLTDWDGDADPGNTDDALDQLAERVDDVESGAVLSASDLNSLYVPLTDGDLSSPEIVFSGGDVVMVEVSK